MIIKYSYCLFFSLFFIHGCSSVNNLHTNTADFSNDADAEKSKGILGTDGSFKSMENDPILKSTHDILQSAPAITQVSVNKQLDHYLEKNTKKNEYSDVW